MKSKKNKRYKLIQKVDKLLAVEAEEADVDDQYSVLGEEGGDVWPFCKKCANEVVDALNNGKSLFDLSNEFQDECEGAEPEGEAYGACYGYGYGDSIESCCKCGKVLSSWLTDYGAATELKEEWRVYNVDDAMSAYTLSQCLNNICLNMHDPNLFDIAYSIARREYRRRVGIFVRAWRLVYWAREKWLVWRERVKINGKN